MGTRVGHLVEKSLPLSCCEIARPGAVPIMEGPVFAPLPTLSATQVALIGEAQRDHRGRWRIVAMAIIPTHLVLADITHIRQSKAFAKALEGISQAESEPRFPLRQHRPIALPKRRTSGATPLCSATRPRSAGSRSARCCPPPPAYRAA